MKGQSIKVRSQGESHTECVADTCRKSLSFTNFDNLEPKIWFMVRTSTKRNSPKVNH